MNLEEDYVIGIVGGMGPQAGLALFDSILRNTHASTDQQHLSTILMSFPGHIVDRTAFLEGDLPINPAYNIVEVIRKLEAAGARVAGIACNTSYSPPIYDVILDQLEKLNSRVKLLNMPLETCQFIRKNYPYIRRIGVMTTNGTYRSQVYEQLLHRFGFETVIPDIAFQTEVIHALIYDRQAGLKANPGILTDKARRLLDKAFRFFRNQQAEAVIFGCTDLSWLLRDAATQDTLIIDSTESLARALIREALHPDRERVPSR